MKKDTTFREFQALNQRRCEEAFPTCADWTLNDWAVALVGEAGELCNLLKKARRGDFTADDRRADLVSEVADVIIYADLLMSQLGVDTGAEVMWKFDEVSRRVGWQSPTASEPPAPGSDSLVSE
jgi:NTP pyrophosphatase (non-canonical NTP hydrolase)